MSDIPIINSQEHRRKEVLKFIKPICRAFDICSYDYIIHKDGQSETLRLENDLIAFSCKSNNYVIEQEIIGWLFLKEYSSRLCGEITLHNNIKTIIQKCWINSD